MRKIFALFLALTALALSAAPVAAQRSPVLPGVFDPAVSPASKGAAGRGASWIEPGALIFSPVRSYYQDGKGGVGNWPTALTGWSFSRSGPELAQRGDGSWASFADSVPAITDLGLSVWEARTNKSTNYNAAPSDLTNIAKSGDAAATLSLVDDAAGLRAAGFGTLIDSGVMNGKVFKLDNSAGSAYAYAIASGVSGNLNTHVYSVVYKGGGGGNAIGTDDMPSVPNGNRRVLLPLAPGYTRFDTGALVVTDQNNRRWSLRADAGAVLYFILNGMEEGSFVTAPIVTAGAAATRAAPSALIDLTAAIASPVTFAGDGRPMATVGSTQRFLLTLSSGVGSTGRYVLLRSSSNNATLATGNSPSTLLFRAGYASATSMKVAGYIDGAGSANFGADGVVSTAAAAPAQPGGGFTRLTIGSAQTGTGSVPLNGSVRSAAVLPYAVSDGQLQVMTAP